MHDGKDAGYMSANALDPGSREREIDQRPGCGYQIRVQGRLDERWSDWFGGVQIACEKGRDGSPVTTLSGTIVDQVALRGILSRLWDLNMVLISVTRIEKRASPSRRESHTMEVYR
jgi:hypothetical protein